MKFIKYIYWCIVGMIGFTIALYGNTQIGLFIGGFATGYGFITAGTILK